LRLLARAWFDFGERGNENIMKGVTKTKIRPRLPLGLKRHELID
jgi:hypothetical protein